MAGPIPAVSEKRKVPAMSGSAAEGDWRGARQKAEVVAKSRLSISDA